MSAIILATKLHIPPGRTSVIPRHRLIERLNDDLHRKLILVSALHNLGKLLW
ncbi:MAG TPA: hypothetical protein VFQ23_25215 [Anaerolineales bacterium]|nr:hypothetical protein [Anaerolineales bacterium]